MRDKLVSCIFIIFLFAGAFLLAFTPDRGVSYSERRALRQFPAISQRTLLDASWMRAYEEYLLDQFPARESLRSIKAFVLTHVFMQLDYNGLFMGEDGHIFAPVYPINEASGARFARSVNELYAQYFTDANVYCAIIPDKSQYSNSIKKRLRLDYTQLADIVGQNLHDDICFIPLYDSLSLSDYYRTDSHWRQEKLARVVARLSEYMGIAADNQGFTQNTYEPFYGVYYGQYALPVRPDELCYLSSKYTDEAYVEDIQNPGRHSVYAKDKLSGMDSYDVFLNGASPLLRITNKNSANGRSLIIFRDSFGSSLAPMLLEAYEYITLVDLRYMSEELVDELVDTKEVDDVLFIYGEQLVNSSIRF